MPFERQLVLAEAFAKSGLFGVKTKEQALALMALCESEGLHPARAVQEYHIIQNRPALKADAMLARFLNAGGRVEWRAYTDNKVEATFSHPAGGSVTVDWTMERAKQAGLGTKDNWRSYPRQMLRSRVISEGIRTVYPGVAVGTYTPEEVQDFTPTGLVDPRGEDLKPMDLDKRNTMHHTMTGLLDKDQSKLTKAEAANLCLQIQDIWEELTQDEQIQVHDGFNTKQKSKLKHVTALDRTMLEATIEGELEKLDKAQSVQADLV